MLLHCATYRIGDTEPGYYEDAKARTHKISLDPYRRESAKIVKVSSDVLLPHSLDPNSEASWLSSQDFRRVLPRCWSVFLRELTCWSDRELTVFSLVCREGFDGRILSRPDTFGSSQASGTVPDAGSNSRGSRSGYPFALTARSSRRCRLGQRW